MATSNKNLHLTDDERKIIQRGIENNSSKKSIADTLGKDKSTIGKEIRNHRTLSYKSKYPVECIDAGKCPNKYSHHCSKECPSFKPFICKRRDRSPGACNGCERYKRCRFDKYKYEADAAQKEYVEMLCDARAGVNATVNEIRDLGLLIKPLLEQGQSLYVICQNHPEIKEIEICTDNDFAGRWAKEQMKKHYEGTYQIICNLPEKEGADYADLAKEKKQTNKCRDRPLERR